MRSIAVMNQKGGVGKTTTSVNLAAALALRGKRVCVIDLDPQAHATLHFGVEAQDEFESVFEVLLENVPLAKVRREVGENIWLVPAHKDLVDAEPRLANAIAREKILKGKLDEDDAEFDFLLIDCPPSLNVLTLNALAAVDEVLVPLQPQFLPLHGLKELLQTVALVAKMLNERLRLGGVVLCQFDMTTRLAAEVAGDVKDFFESDSANNTPWAGAHVFQTVIRRNVRLAEAPSYGKPIFDYDPNSNGAEDYRNLAAELLEVQGDVG